MCRGHPQAQIEGSHFSVGYLFAGVSWFLTVEANGLDEVALLHAVGNDEGRARTGRYRHRYRLRVQLARRGSWHHGVPWPRESNGHGEFLPLSRPVTNKLGALLAGFAVLRPWRPVGNEMLLPEESTGTEMRRSAGAGGNVPVRSGPLLPAISGAEHALALQHPGTPHNAETPSHSSPRLQMRSVLVALDVSNMTSPRTAHGPRTRDRETYAAERRLRRPNTYQAVKSGLALKDFQMLVVFILWKRKGKGSQIKPLRLGLSGSRRREGSAKDNEERQQSFRKWAMPHIAKHRCGDPNRQQGPTRNRRDAAAAVAAMCPLAVADDILAGQNRDKITMLPWKLAILTLTIFGARHFNIYLTFKI
ncbi:hypothetical protein FB451DRAFT_1174087 [Mycena latifolia]|nr:hypothetical protein FB451DRAFT_1174087 [Mycena latifolia]